MGFTTFKFHPAIVAGIREAGYSRPTPIQNEAIPLILAGHDLLGLAQTGTGKTAAFALPILHRLMSGARHQTRALVIAPTRELAEQIEATFRLLAHQSGLKSATVYGGVGQRPQVQALERGTEIIVACPGRLLDLMEQGHAALKSVEVLVLDEADQMFDMGFFPMIRTILKRLPAKRQTLMFSATMPESIRALAGESLHEPKTVQIDTIKPATTVRHALYPVEQHLKTALLMELLKTYGEGSVLVFTRTKHRAKRVGEQLQKAGHQAASLQGNLSQNRRQEAMDGFRDGSYRILVATDIAARGIDVSLIRVVINYDMPETPETYIHRIGRTGRAERSGEALTFTTRDDAAMIRAVEKTLGKPIERRQLSGFDYSVPAPSRDVEFQRPPRQPRPVGKKKEAASAARTSSSTVPDRPAGKPLQRAQPGGATNEAAASQKRRNRRPRRKPTPAQ